MRNKLVKKLTYRDSTGSPVETHAAAWEGFEFMSGPYVCMYVGPWGEIQVWAESPEEGRRVALHALRVGGWEARINDGEFVSTRTSSHRLGRVVRVVVAQAGGLIAVSKRNGSSGPPNWPGRTKK